MAILTELLNDQPKVKLLLYGHSGTGKTCFCVSAPKPFIFDFDGKVRSAAMYLAKNNPEKLKEVEYDGFPRIMQDGKTRCFQKFKVYLSRLEQLAVEGKFPYKTVCLDSITLFIEALMEDIMAENPGVKRVNAQTPSIQDYGMLAIQFREVMGRILALPANVIVTAHITSETNQETGRIVWKPMVSGKLADRLPQIFNEVYRPFVRNTKESGIQHLAQTRSDGEYVCRTEIPDLPMEIPLAWGSVEEYANKVIAGAKPQKSVAVNKTQNTEQKEEG